MKMTEPFGSSSLNIDNNVINSSTIDHNIKYEKRYNKSSTMIENNNNNNSTLFSHNALTIETAPMINGQSPSAISSPASSSAAATKPLKIVLKVGNSGSYSPASSSSTTINSFHNNTNHINYNFNENNHKNGNNIVLTPPELLPLNSDTYNKNINLHLSNNNNNIINVNSININNRKAKKKKKKHHHHHHHHNHNNIGDDNYQHNHNHVIFNDNNSFDQSTIINNIVNNVNNSSNNCMEIDDEDSSSLSLKGIDESDSLVRKTINKLQPQNSIDNDDNNAQDAGDVNNNNDDDDAIMSINQDSIFSSVDLIDVDSCSKLDISALVSDEMMISELNNNNNQNLINNANINEPSNNNSDEHRTRTKLKPTSSIYRQLLRNKQVKCDSKNLYEHLRRCEKINSKSKYHLTNASSTSESSNQIVFQNFLMSLLKRLEMKDTRKLFAWPVIDSLTPGYSQVIRHPMDFNTIRKKIEHNLYKSVAELKYDIRLLCENAIRYYRHSGFHYCEASRLWYYAKTRIFARDQLAEQLKQFPPLTILDLGMDDPKMLEQNKDNLKLMNNVPITNGISASSASVVPSTSSLESSTTSNPSTSLSVLSKNLSLKSLLHDAKCEPLIDDHQSGHHFSEQTPQLILEQHEKKLKEYQQNFANNHDIVNDSIPKLTLSKLKNSNNPIKVTRQKIDGTTTLPFIINHNSFNNEMTIGELSRIVLENEDKVMSKQSTASSISNSNEEAFKDDCIKPFEYIEESLQNPFGSYLPFMDSSNSTITHDDTVLLFNTFDQYETSKYTEEIERIANDDTYLYNAHVDSLLTVVSNGEYKKSTIDANIEQNVHDSSENKLKCTKNDGDNNDEIQHKLFETKNYIENLEQTQLDRLRKTHEPLQPSNDEYEMAEKVTTNLVEIIRQWFQPQHLIDPETIHRNLGIEFDKNEIDSNDEIPTERHQQHKENE